MSEPLLPLGALPTSPFTPSSSPSPSTLGIILAAVSVTILVILGIFILDRLLRTKERGGFKASLGLDAKRRVSSGIRGAPLLVRLQWWWDGVLSELEERERRSDVEKGASNSEASEDGNQRTRYPPLRAGKAPAYLKYHNDTLRRPGRARLPLLASSSSNHRHHERHRRHRRHSHDLSHTTSSSSSSNRGSIKRDSTSPSTDAEAYIDAQSQAFKRGVEKAFDYMTSRNRPSLEPGPSSAPPPFDFGYGLGLGGRTQMNSAWPIPEPASAFAGKQQQGEDGYYGDANHDMGGFQYSGWQGGRTAPHLGHLPGGGVGGGNVPLRRVFTGKGAGMPYMPGFRQQRERMRKGTAKGRGKRVAGLGGGGGGYQQQQGQVLGEIAEV